MIEKAKKIAERYHEGQLDKSGKPYINHPFTVAELVEGELEKVVAYLHDTIEDTDYTEEMLRADFPQVVADAVMALSKQEGETYSQFIDRAKKNPIARKVKIADITHNMDMSRIPDPTEWDFIRQKRYEKNLKKLLRED